MSEHAILTLLAIASVAIAISGFSGVVAVFGSHPDGKWLAQERFRATNMLVLSLGTCLLSFVPIVEELFQIPSPMLWTIASFLLLSFGSFYFVHTIIRLRRPSLRRPGALNARVRVLYLVSLLIAIILQALSVFGVFVERGPGPFIGGLMFVLIPAGLQFAMLVLTPLTSAEI